MNARLSLLAVVLVPALAGADFSQPGPLGAGRFSGTFSHQGASYPYELHAPCAPGASCSASAPAGGAGGPYPVVVLGHGFCNAPENYRNFGALLASRGMVVVVPKLECSVLAFTDAARLQLHTGNAQRMLAALDAVLAQGGAGGPLTGRLDGASVALAGHSAGGLSALLASGLRPSVRALVLLDAVDSATGSRASPAPTLMLSTAPAQCNGSGNSAGWYAQVQAGQARSRMRVVGASHCDMQDPVHSSCSFAGCVGSNAVAVRPVFLRHTAAWLAAHLSCDAAAAQAASRAGADLQADLQGGLIADLAQDLDGDGAEDAAGGVALPLPAACGSAQVDAGVPPADAGSGAAPDAGSAVDGGGVAADAGSGQADGGGIPGDAGTAVDAGSSPQSDAGAGAPADAGSGSDGERDAGTWDGADAGADGQVPPVGCGCTQLPGSVLVAWAALALGAWARPRRRGGR